MITVFYSKKDSTLAEIVFKSFIRSFSKTQVELALYENTPKKPGIFVLLNPANISLKTFPEKSKIIILGKIDSQLADELSIHISNDPITLSEEAVIRFNPINNFYFPIQSRPLVRFDFGREWNNLGFGGIKTDGSIWSIYQHAKSKYAVAHCNNLAYITLHDFDDRACLWVNRAVGLVDSANWKLIEYFVSEHRFSDLISLPYLLDIPVDVEAAVTMRLDCDEDILSAKPLYNAYQEKRVPFSLAVKTSLPRDSQSDDFLRVIYHGGGAILSHSVNHKVAWGDDYDDALHEATSSKSTLEKIMGRSVHFAVSPFHSNKDYSVSALENAQYHGFVGGIIGNDPEYLMARGGAVPFSDKIISHSQQCMLHGDCLLGGDDSLRGYKNAFDIALQSKTFFGFLDHPFSPRYQYGWETEAQRIEAHMELIDYMRYHSDVLFVNQNDCLNFMIDKANTQLHYDQNKATVIAQQRQSAFRLGCSIGGRVME